MKLPADPFRLDGLRRTAARSPLAELASITHPDTIHRFNHGDLPRWLETIERLPKLHPDSIDLKRGVRIGSPNIASDLSDELESSLRQFIPWRKGPFELFGLRLETEWDSAMKWDRLLPHLSPLTGRKVLDVGCGNGYHCWRAIGEGALQVIGIEPYLLYVMQFLAIRNYLAELPCYVLPVRLEDYPGPFDYFDTVLSMGVIYHVRSPIDHLLTLKNCLTTGGELLLETLVVDGDEGYSLTPEDRYARMGNVWFIPSTATLERWLQRCGFVDIRLVDVSVTSEAEQHTTPWMPFQSLIDGLDPLDPSRTCEGLPAPQRAIVIARNPG